MTSTTPSSSAYPARLEIDYPKEGLGRASTAFRLILMVPIIMLWMVLAGNALDWTQENVGLEIWAALLAAFGFVFLPALLMIDPDLRGAPGRSFAPRCSRWRPSARRAHGAVAAASSPVFMVDTDNQGGARPTSLSRNDDQVRGPWPPRGTVVSDRRGTCRRRRCRRPARPRCPPRAAGCMPPRRDVHQPEHPRPMGRSAALDAWLPGPWVG